MSRKYDYESAIQDYLSGMSQASVGKKYDVSQTTISAMLRKEDIPTRPANHNKYTCNESFFNDLAQELPAYWLGFIFADGQVRRRSPGRSGELVLAQSAKDIGLLKRFKQDIIFTGPVKTDNYGMAFLRITSETLFQQLLSFGVHQRKQWNEMVFPGCVPGPSMHHFLRGFFDGDGGIYVYLEGGKPYPTIQVSSKSKEFLIRIRCELWAVCPPQVGCLVKGAYDVWTLKWRGFKNCPPLARYLYGDCTVSLERKLLKAQEIMALGAQPASRTATTGASRRVDQFAGQLGLNYLGDNLLVQE